MARRYGMSYQGSKNAIAEEILSFLPPGKRFVDLFGGGGAITDCAMQSYKWESFLYNEYNPLIAKAFSMAMHGEFKGENRWISKEDFNRLKGTDPYVALCFSFGNNLQHYCYGKEYEPWKKALHYARVFKDFSLLREFGIDTDDVSRKSVKLHSAEYKAKYIDWYQKRFKERLERLQSLQRLERLQSLESLERLQSLESLQSLERLEITNDTYLNYVYQDGDVVYLDPPYEGTSGYNGSSFDTKEFYDWCATRPYRVFFSSYDISDNRFHRIWEREKLSIYSATNNSIKKIECLYTNEPYMYESLLGKQLEFSFV